MGADAVGHLPMDGFHLADVQLDRLGRRDRKGAPDTFDVDGYVAALAPSARPNPTARCSSPASSATSSSPSPRPSRSRRRPRLVVTEGNYLLLPRRRLGARTPHCWPRCGTSRSTTTYAASDWWRRHEQFGKSARGRSGLGRARRRAQRTS